LGRKVGIGGTILLALTAIGVTIPGAEGLAPVQRQDALTAARFSSTIDGHEIASFTELQGVTTSVDVPSVTGGEQAGPTIKTVDIVLRRGLSHDLAMWAWHEAVMLGGLTARRSATIVMYSETGSPVARFELENAWPKKIEVGTLKTGASEVLMETVTVTAEQIGRVAI
jgi:phage tail-like protein